MSQTAKKSDKALSDKSLSLRSNKKHRLALAQEVQAHQKASPQTTGTTAVKPSVKTNEKRPVNGSALILGILIAMSLGGYSVYRSRLNAENIALKMPPSGTHETVGSRPITSGNPSEMLPVIAALGQQQAALEDNITNDLKRMEGALQTLQTTVERLEKRLSIPSETNPSEHFMRLKKAFHTGKPFAALLPQMHLPQRYSTPHMSEMIEMVMPYADTGVLTKTQVLSGLEQTKEMPLPTSKQESGWSDKVRNWVVSQVKVTTSNPPNNVSLRAAIEADDYQLVADLSHAAQQAAGPSAGDTENATRTFLAQVHAYAQANLLLHAMEQHLIGAF